MCWRRDATLKTSNASQNQSVTLKVEWGWYLYCLQRCGYYLKGSAAPKYYITHKPSVAWFWVFMYSSPYNVIQFLPPLGFFIFVFFFFFFIVGKLVKLLNRHKCTHSVYFKNRTHKKNTIMSADTLLHFFPQTKMYQSLQQFLGFFGKYIAKSDKEQKRFPQLSNEYLATYKCRTVSQTCT